MGYILYSLTYCLRRGERFKYNHGFGGFIPQKLEWYCITNILLFLYNVVGLIFTEHSFLFLNVIIIAISCL